MRAVVLVKQVPDVRAGNVGTRSDGTIDRANAPAITNPADLHAVEAALSIADEVIALSMGPERAEAAIREAIAMGANSGVLLSDRAFAGSDTWATANALAAAIQRLGPVDLVLAGVSALDGETGHVGPQVAQRLGWHQVTGCEAIGFHGEKLMLRRVVEGGYENVATPLPAVITISETGFLPRYPTLPGRRRADTAEVPVWTLEDLGLDKSLVGLESSPTKVAHMEMVPLPRVSCQLVGEDFGYDDLVAELERRRHLDVPVAHPVPAVTLGEAAPSDDGEGVWVVGETRRGELAPVTTELLSKAVEIGDALGTGVAVVLLGSGLDDAIAEAARFGADLVLVGDHEGLSNYRGEPESRLITAAIQANSPDIVLFGATTTGRALAPRVAAMLDTGIAADCTDLYVGDWERRGRVFNSILHQVRPAMAGGVLATCICPERRPQIATVRPGVFPPVTNAKAVNRVDLDVMVTEADEEYEILGRDLRTAGVSLSEAEVIVAGGAGCSQETWHLIEDLAGQLEGKVAASRAAVEAGLAPRSAQVGQTGTTVRPSLYVAIGISGALQHVVGMKGAATILAINRDPKAAIFRFAHLGVVGDVSDVLPQLTQALKRAD